MTPQLNIAEIRRLSPSTTSGTGPGRYTVLGALSLLTVSWLAPGVLAQGPAGASPDEPLDLQFTVTEAETRAEIISVPLNQGVLVDFNVPIHEVRVANSAIADVAATSPRQILVDGKSYGTTQLIVVVEGGQQRMFTIAVDLDLARLQAGIEQAVPRARVKASGMLDTVVLTGTVPDIESAEHITQIAGIYSKQVLNQMRVAGVQQVLLRCTVAEINRTATRQLGFNGWMAGDNFPDVFAVQQLNGINPVNIGAAKETGISGVIPFATDASEGLPLRSAPTLSFGFPRMQMQVFIQALRENGLLKVLAEPNLVTISGEEASFLAGGEFPVPVPQRDSVTIQFREFGVRLKFTPTVLAQDVIRLRVAPEVSEPDYTNSVSISGWVIPGLATRRVETVVELGPGQTFAIGGLLSERTRAISSKIPALGDLPVLGALFSSVDYQSDESELVVLVTPELIAPLNPDQLAYIPGADHIAPNDWELFALGKIEGEGYPTEQTAEDPKEPVWHRLPAGGTAGTEPGRNIPVWHRLPAGEAVSEPSAAVRLRGPIGPAGGNEGT
ncbi:MAG: type II and III secretion system protein family protein [Phycisphaerae bacterium]|nr:type II and III secretion system protein family protein [Phycisphaerae bacterium]